MKQSILLITLFIISNAQQTNYQLDLSTSLSTDLYRVRVYPSGIKTDLATFNFVAVTPGTYKRQDFGRFVRSFKAFSDEGKKLNVTQINMNQWQIFDSKKLSFVEYTIEDSYDSADRSNPLYPMSGTSIDSSYILVNTFGVFGYFADLQYNPIGLEIIQPAGWTIETAMNRDSDGQFHATSFNNFADFPILIGKKLKKRTLDTDQLKIDVVVYSSNDSISVDQVVETAAQVRQAAMEFIGFSPVDHYSFLMCFFDTAEIKRNNFFGFGALEHSYSSFYAFPEDNNGLSAVKSTMAHEFFHIVTPLTIHSEIIEEFNFLSPVPSEHLWLYEGVTDWAADMMLLRSKQMDLETYLKTVSSYIATDRDFYDRSYSLSRIALECYDPESRKQYGNIYARGNYNAALLDILLLKLSHTKMGLRELIIVLSKKYGKARAFPEKAFFDEIVRITFPEVADYINQYIKGNKPYPIAEYFSWLGIKYIPERISKNQTPVMGISFGQTNDNQITIGGFSKNHQAYGLQRGDVILSLFGKTLDLSSLPSVLAEIANHHAGESYEIEVRRNDKTLKLTGHFLQRMDYHILEVDPNANSEQLEFRRVWMNYLQ